MATLLFLGLVFAGVVCSLVVLPLLLLKAVFGVTLSIISIPFQILGGLIGGLTRGVFKGMFWVALLLIPLALVALPLTIMMFGAWLLYRIVRPRRRPPQAYVVA